MKAVDLVNRNLILVQDRNNYFFRYVKEDSIDICTTYKSGVIFRILKKIPLLSICAYPNWKKSIDEYDKIIIFDSVFNVALALYLKIVFHKPVYVYSWNSAINLSQKKLLNKAKIFFPTFSFDKRDCASLSLKYAPMVYSRDAVQSISEEIIYDVVFVGKDKGRTKYLYELFNMLTKSGLNCRFIILGEEKKDYIKPGFEFIEKYLSYSENSKLIRQSKAILDVQQDMQEGLTIRVVEAMFYEKKIITNKQDIDTYDFYNPSNVISINKSTTASQVIEFINKDFVKLSDEITDRYDMREWVNNFK